MESALQTAVQDKQRLQQEARPFAKSTLTCTDYARCFNQQRLAITAASGMIVSRDWPIVHGTPPWLPAIITFLPRLRPSSVKGAIGSCKQLV